jgi:hypothetical protein
VSGSFDGAGLEILLYEIHPERFRVSTIWIAFCLFALPSDLNRPGGMMNAGKTLFAHVTEFVPWKTLTCISFTPGAYRKHSGNRNSSVGLMRVVN